MVEWPAPEYAALEVGRRVRAVLVDPLGLHPDVDAPRFADLGGVVDALLG